jgi:MFS family permease
MSRPGLWRQPSFMRFWTAQTASEHGDRISELAIPLIAITILDASPAQVGLLTAAVWLPNLASLLVGAWVDQQAHKRRLMIAADLFRAVVLLSVPIAFWLDAMTLGQLYAVALLAGTAHVVFNTAYASFFVSLVSRDEYLDANGKLSSTRSMSFIVGPALGGLLVQWLRAPVALLADALTFLFSAAQLARVKVPNAAVRDETESLLRRARAGLKYVLRDSYLRASLGCATTLNFFNFIGAAVLLLFASRELHLPAGTIGLALGIGASGGLLGALVAPRLAKRFPVGVVIAVSCATFSGSVAIVAMAGGPMWVRVGALASAEFIGGFAVMCFDVPLNSLQAMIIPGQLRSRVSGAFSSINYGIRPIGAVLGGLLGSWIGIRPTLIISAVGGMFAVGWLIGSPIFGLRDLDALVVSPAEVGSTRVPITPI